MTLADHKRSRREASGLAQNARWARAETADNLDRWEPCRFGSDGLVELPKLLATRVPGWGWTGDIHSLLANYGLLSLVCVHVAAALYHYLIRRDGVLQRVLPA
jgi:hypothetical protein